MLYQLLTNMSTVFGLTMQRNRGNVGKDFVPLTRIFEDNKKHNEPLTMSLNKDRENELNNHFPPQKNPSTYLWWETIHQYLAAPEQSKLNQAHIFFRKCILTPFSAKVSFPYSCSYAPPYLFVRAFYSFCLSFEFQSQQKRVWVPQRFCLEATFVILAQFSIKSICHKAIKDTMNKIVLFLNCDKTEILLKYFFNFAYAQFQDLRLTQLINYLTNFFNKCFFLSGWNE